MDLRALVTLWNITQKHPGTSGARVSGRVLLGLYNGGRFPFDLSDLRVLDANILEAAWSVIKSDATRCEKEVQEWLNELTQRIDFGDRFEHLAYQLRLKGRAKRKFLNSVHPKILVIDFDAPVGNVDAQQEMNFS